MRIVFRTDASIQIGTGHVMRCLTLADAFREKGAQCTFICRLHSGHLLELIHQRGHEPLALPSATDSCLVPTEAGYMHWLGTDWISDAQQCQQALGDQMLDWLVIDHYSLDRRWESVLRKNTQRILVIDDLANRPHECDVLLDQNLGRFPKDYFGLINEGTTKLIGPQYSLLRPEFAAIRDQSLARRRNQSQLKHLLITMGGVDKNNATCQVLDALMTCKLPHDLRLSIVMGSRSPWLNQVQRQVANMPWPAEVLTDVSNMAQVMESCDLAIGAAGGTVWEFCAVGLPSVLLIQAENQMMSAVALQNVNAARVLNSYHQMNELLYNLHLFNPMNTQLLELAHAAAEVTDGSGCERVVQQILKNHA